VSEAKSIIHFGVRLRAPGPSQYISTGKITGDELAGLAQLQDLMLREIAQGHEVVIWRAKPHAAASIVRSKAAA